MLWFLVSLFLIFGLFLFLVFPAARRHPHRTVLKGRFIAHRGLHDAARPENSLPAFEAAIAAGYTIELDVHLTADGEVVVFHDDTLTRMCGTDGVVEETTLGALKSLRLKNSDEPIPTFSECLERINGQVPLLIEFKVHGGNTVPLCETVDRILADYKGEYIIQSFYPPVLRWYRQNRPHICRGQLSAPFLKENFVHILAGCLLFNVIARPDFVSYDHMGAAHPCRRLCTLLGALPVGWTFHSQKEIDAHRADFEGFIFEGFTPQ
ncbi:MAG: glycerophosphodiester phosphodiesterase [Ruminococcaceae bacterium]|nr:glycerophosphodiester phosphodiesterase [Oscillospiraceae bacterium]